MIRKQMIEDIFSEKFPHDIVFGMNPTFSELSEVAQAAIQNELPPNKLLPLGSVVTFNFSSERLAYAIICHHLGKDGWENSERYLRFGLDYIRTWYDPDNSRTYGIVRVGTGVIGKRDGAPEDLLLKAMMDSYLEMDLFFRPPSSAVSIALKDYDKIIPLKLFIPEEQQVFTRA